MNSWEGTVGSEEKEERVRELGKEKRKRHKKGTKGKRRIVRAVNDSVAEA